MELAGADPDSWAIGFEDECWWSRVALPVLNAWSEEGKPLRLVQRSVAKDDPEPKAVSCYGLYLPEFDQTWLRFVDGRPVSSITIRFLQWSCEKLEAAGKKRLLLIWDNASWHVFLQGGQGLARFSQPPRQKERRGSEDRELPASEAESVAQRHRAKVGTRQAQGRRTRRVAWSLRACREGMPGVRLSSLRASLRYTEGRLIMH